MSALCRVMRASGTTSGARRAPGAYLRDVGVPGVLACCPMSRRPAATRGGRLGLIGRSCRRTSGATMPETKNPFRIRPLTIVFGAAALVLIVVAIVYLTMSHPKHALLFFGLAVLALVGAWFSTGESRLRP